MIVRCRTVPDWRQLLRHFAFISHTTISKGRNTRRMSDVAASQRTCPPKSVLISLQRSEDPEIFAFTHHNTHGVRHGVGVASGWKTVTADGCCIHNLSKHNVPHNGCGHCGGSKLILSRYKSGKLLKENSFKSRCLSFTLNLLG